MVSLIIINEKVLMVVSLSPSPDQLAIAVSSIMQERFKSPSERTVFWDEQLGKNVDPLANVVGGFWGADWDLKVRYPYSITWFMRAYFFNPASYPSNASRDSTRAYPGYQRNY